MVANTGHVRRLRRTTGSRTAPTSPGLPLDRLADLPASWSGCARRRPRQSRPRRWRPTTSRAGRCCLHTGDSDRFGTPEYVVDPSFLTRDGAAWLVDAGRGPGRHRRGQHRRHDRRDASRAHRCSSTPGIPIVEHLTGLDRAAARRRDAFTAVAADGRGVRDVPGARVRLGAVPADGRQSVERRASRRVRVRRVGGCCRDSSR